jgi:hypothetical protein
LSRAYLVGNVLTFSTSLDVISDHSVDGNFMYDLQLTRFGGDPGKFLPQRRSVVRPSRPASKAQCNNGGWRNFPGFKNQGACVSFVATGGKQAARPQTRSN